MLNQRYYVGILLLCLGLGIGISPAYASNCSLIVAKIHKTDGIDNVRIFRYTKGKYEQASRKNRQLCADDMVIVPKSVKQLKISYHSEVKRRITLKAGQQYTVEALKTSGMTDKLVAKIKGIFAKWKTEPSEPFPTKEAAPREYKNSKPLPIFMPLAAGEGADYPFYLFSREGAIPLYWDGGQPPYQLTVKDAAGKTIVEEEEIAKNAKAKFSLNLPDTEPYSEYILTIKCDNCLIYKKTFVFRLPPFPLDASVDKKLMLASLLADCNRNWRLEIWRQLSAMPDSKLKLGFMGDLDADDLDELGCQ